MEFDKVRKGVFETPAIPKTKEPSEIIILKNEVSQLNEKYLQLLETVNKYIVTQNN